LRIPFCLAVFPDARFIHVVRDGREVIPEMLGGWLLKPELGNMVKTRLRSSEVRRWLRLSGILPRATTWASNWVRHRIGRRKKAWGPTVPGQAEFAKSHSLPETVAYQWLKIVEFAVRGLKEVSDDRVLEMRREKVLSNPGKEFERVAAFAEIQDPGPMIQVANDLIRPDREDPVIKAVQPSDEEWPKILKMIEPMQRELGYVHPGT